MPSGELVDERQAAAELDRAILLGLLAALILGRRPRPPRPRRRVRMRWILAAAGVVLLAIGAAANYGRSDSPGCGPGGRQVAATMHEVLGPCVDTFRHGPRCVPVTRPRRAQRPTPFTLPSCEYPGR